jgi:hypothetical protein
MITLDAITLPDGLIWEDEFDWTPVSQELAITITGSLLVQEGAALAGRPITLKGYDDGCWTSRSVIETLHALAQTADKVMTLVIGSSTKSVIWQRGNTAPVEARQVLPVTGPENDTLYILSALRFLEVDE